MDELPHSPRDDEDPNPSEEKVVRLSVANEDLADQLEPLPAPDSARVKMKPTQTPSLVDEELDMGEPIPQDLGVGWDESGEEEKKQTPSGWIGLIGVILCILGVWALTKMWKGEAHIETESELVAARLDDDQQAHRDAEEFIGRLEKAIDAYLAASTVDEKSAFVRHPERVLPLMKRHYEEHELEPANLDRIVKLDAITLSKRPFVFVHARMKTGFDLLLVAEQGSGGGVKFDWEAEVSYQPMSIGDYIEKRPLEPMDFRVFAKLDSHYAFEFADSARYQSVMLSALGTDEWLFGYADRGTEAGKEVIDLLKAGYPDSRGRPLLLRVRYLPDSHGKRMVLIQKMMSPRWSYVEKPES